MLDGSPLIQLPKRTMVVERLLFTPEEKDFYDAIRQRHSVRFDAFVAEGRVLNNYAHVLAMLQQMRQACDHPFLVLARPDKEGDVTKIGNTLLKRWKELHRQGPATGAGGGGGGDGEASAAAARQPSEAFIASTLQHIQNLQQRAQRTNSGDGTSRPPSREDPPPLWLRGVVLALRLVRPSPRRHPARPRFCADGPAWARPPRGARAR